MFQILDVDIIRLMDFRIAPLQMEVLVGEYSDHRASRCDVRNELCSGFYMSTSYDL